MPVPSNPAAAVAGQPTHASTQFNQLASQVTYLIGGATGRRAVMRANFASTLQSVPNNASTNIVFPQLLQDTDGGYSTSTGIYTVQTAGIYLVNARSYWASNATGIRGLWVNHSSSSAGESWMTASSDAASNGRANITTIVSAAVGETFNVVAYQNSGAALNFGVANSDIGEFTVVWLSS